MVWEHVWGIENWERANNEQDHNIYNLINNDMLEIQKENVELNHYEPEIIVYPFCQKII